MTQRLCSNPEDEAGVSDDESDALFTINSDQAEPQEQGSPHASLPDTHKPHVKVHFDEAALTSKLEELQKQREAQRDLVAFDQNALQNKLEALKVERDAEELLAEKRSDAESCRDNSGNGSMAAEGIFFFDEEHVPADSSAGSDARIHVGVEHQLAKEIADLVACGLLEYTFKPDLQLSLPEKTEAKEDCSKDAPQQQIYFDMSTPSEDVSFSPGVVNNEVDMQISTAIGNDSSMFTCPEKPSDIAETVDPSDEDESANASTPSEDSDATSPRESEAQDEPRLTAASDTAKDEAIAKALAELIACGLLAPNAGGD